MLRTLRPFVLAIALAPAVAAVSSTASSADGGRCGDPGRPACTILRPVPAPADRSFAADAPACIVVVGGLGSGAYDDFFDPILDRLDVAHDERPYLKLRFGHDRGERFPYLTSGAIDRNAAHLRALVRDLSDECSTIDVLAHSMGGAVADRAFSLGVSSRDGVTTYLPLASPHNGSFVARAMRLGVELSDAFAVAASSLAERTGLHDPTSDALRDLARIARPSRPPRGVETVRQRLVTDLLVLRRDGVDRRYDAREYLVGSLAELEGHSGIVANEHAGQVIARTIRTHAVPPDERPVLEVKAASFASRAVDRYWAGVVAGLGLALADLAIGSEVGVAARDAATTIAAGDPAGAAARVGDAAGTLAARAIDRAPQEIELVRAAAELREPLPLALLRLALGAALE